MSSSAERGERSILLIGLSYPLLLLGLFLIFSGGTLAGAIIVAASAFLIGVTEMCRRPVDDSARDSEASRSAAEVRRR